MGIPIEELHLEGDEQNADAVGMERTANLLLNFGEAGELVIHLDVIQVRDFVADASRLGLLEG